MMGESRRRAATIDRTIVSAQDGRERTIEKPSHEWSVPPRP